jgi:hypothetical protein
VLLLGFALGYVPVKFNIVRPMNKCMSLLRRVFTFYLDGFRDMPRWGKQLWVIIILKIFILFFVFRLFFFPNYLKSNFDSDADRSMHVIQRLTEIIN